MISGVAYIKTNVIIGGELTECYLYHSEEATLSILKFTVAYADGTKNMEVTRFQLMMPLLLQCMNSQKSARHIKQIKDIN